MKAIDIAIKDLRRSFRSTFAIIFMFGVPLLVTGMFYLMFGNIAQNGGFNLPQTKVVIANLDKGGPKIQVNPKNIPGGKKARTMGDLVVNILQSEDMADLIEVSFATDALAARAAVDGQQAQVALIIPADFSKQFADLEGKAVIEFYQDPTLTIGPAIMRSILNRFMDGMSGVKIAANLFMDQAADSDLGKTGLVIQRYLDESLTLSDDPKSELMLVQAPVSMQSKTEQSENLLLNVVGGIMGGMLVFYAFYTGASTAESILREEEERTLPRLFTTPTPEATIMTGKFLSVFMMVAVQVIVLIFVSRLIFKIRWGDPASVALIAAGIIISASSFGVFVNSFLKDTKQGGVVFGGILTVTGMLGMIPTFTAGSPSSGLVSTVSLLVPQGWGVRGLTQAMKAEPIEAVGLTVLALLAWSAVFFLIGVWRFNRRYT
jgi:ABC-2 type transport system permease protein